MITETLPLQTNDRGKTAVHGRLWMGREETRKGVVILVHGLGDHGGRFDQFASHLVQRGWAVYAMDLPGHGRSPGRRGCAKDYNSLLATIARARQAMQARFDSLPQVLMGHSMGGNLALNYALRQSEFESGQERAIDGLVLLAPMLRAPQHLDRNMIFAAWGTGHCLRWMRISKPARVDQLTSDRQMAQRIESDPLQHSKISLYLATQLLAQGRFALDHASQLKVPTMVMYGEKDELIDQAACRGLAMRMSRSPELISWPGGKHDLGNDQDASAIRDRLVRWLDAKVPQSLPLREALWTNRLSRAA